METSEIRNFKKTSLTTSRSKKKLKVKVKYLSLYSFCVYISAGACVPGLVGGGQESLFCQPVGSTDPTELNSGLWSSGLYTNYPVLPTKQSRHPQREILKRLEANKNANLECQYGNIIKITLRWKFIAVYIII